MNIRNILPEVIVFNSEGSVDLGRYAYSIVISNSTNNAVGSCQITFTPDANIQDSITLNMPSFKIDIRKYLRKNSVVAVKINRRHKSYQFLGFIDHVYERKVSRNQNTYVGITINCSMLLPKMLVRDDIVIAPQIHYLPEIQADPILSMRSNFFDVVRGLLPNGENVFAGKPERAVRWILNNCLATNSLAIDLKGKSISVQSFVEDTTDYSGNKTKDFHFLQNELLFSLTLSRYTGTILNYIWAVLDKEFYEVFFDATANLNNEPVSKIVIRPKPFTYKDLDNSGNGWSYWDDLKSYVIDKNQVLDESIGQNDFELKNFFQVYFVQDIVASEDSVPAKFGYHYPVLNIPLIKKYGLRSLVARSTLANFNHVIEEYKDAISKGDSKRVSSIAEKYLKDALLDKRDKLVQWYGFPHYETGQITVKGGDYKIGNKLFYKDKIYFDEEEGKFIEGVEYYIAGVSHKFVIPSFYETTLTVTRGAPIGYVVEWFNKHDKDFTRINKILTQSIKDILPYDKLEQHNKRNDLENTYLELREVPA